MNVKQNSESYFNLFNIYYNIFTKLLVVKKYIENSVNKYLKHNNIYSYIGLQIRIGNEDLKEKRISNTTDIDVMIEVAKKCGYKKWYLTGDSKKIKIKLKNRYNQIFLYNTNITNHYNHNKRDYSIVIEHELLSRSNKLLISKSTYGLTALLKSGLLILEENNSFEVKDGKVFNIRNCFFKFHE